MGGSYLLSVMAYAHAKTAVHLSTAGEYSHATPYSLSEYLYWSDLAARYDYTLEELQKSGALFWSWLATGRPPLP